MDRTRGSITKNRIRKGIAVWAMAMITACFILTSGCSSAGNPPQDTTAKEPVSQDTTAKEPAQHPYSSVHRCGKTGDH